ncbi:MAG TPA: hypothetical protein VFM29_00180, partial [Vicinamibacteria bacterium]|nr:hypothetical protein [Vicinamibacteria bacterium]
MRVRLGLLALAGLSLLAADLSAQDRAQRMKERDRNGDGVLSRGEYVSTGGHPGNFNALDVNGDGVLSYAEFVERRGRADDPEAEAQGQAPSTLVKDSRVLELDHNRDNVI